MNFALIRLFRRLGFAALALLLLGISAWLHPQHFGLWGQSGQTLFHQAPQFKPWLTRIRHDKVVPVGYVPWFFPFSYSRQGGAPQGFSVELTALVVKELGKTLAIPELKAQFVPMSLPEAVDQPLPALADHDVAFECTASLDLPDHPPALILSEPFFISSVHFMSNVAKPVRKNEQVRGKLLLAQEGSFQRWADHRLNDELALNTTLTPYPILQYATVLAEQGQGYAIVGDALRLFSVFYALQTGGSDNWRLGGDVGELGYACAMLASEKELQGLINQALTKVLASDDYQNIYQKWFVVQQEESQMTLNYPMPKGLMELIQKNKKIIMN